MRGATILDTETIPDTAGYRCIGGVPEVIRSVRHDVALATELRRPERVNDVGGPQSEIHGAADREINLVGGGDTVLGISEFPPPLVSGDVDVERARRRLRLRDEDRLHRRHRDENQNHCRYERPRDLELRATVRLWRSSLILSTSVFEHDVDECALDQNEDDCAEEEQAVPEEIDLAAEIGVRD